MDEQQPARPTTVIVAGGDPLDRTVLHGVPRERWTIAADSGLDVARAIGLGIDVVIGDMDSVDPNSLTDAADEGTEIVTHPRDKDATDLELAVDLALSSGSTELVILGGHGGRLDHLVANTLLVASVPGHVTVTWRFGTTTVHPVDADRPLQISGARGDVVSIVPIHGDVRSVTTRGLRWQLERDTLRAGSTRGISNEMTADTARVTVAGDVALVIHERKT